MGKKANDTENLVLVTLKWHYLYISFPTHRWLGDILLFLYLFVVVIVMLNLLIAQMSDTYTNVQKDAHRSLALDRAWIIARVEHNSILGIVSEMQTL